MDKVKVNKFIDGLKSVKWCYNTEICDISHSRHLNVEGAFYDVFLEGTKAKWSDYLLPTVEQYELKKMYDKYITPEQLDLNKLKFDAMVWYEITTFEYDQIFCIKHIGFLEPGYEIKNIVESM